MKTKHEIVKDFVFIVNGTAAGGMEKYAVVRANGVMTCKQYQPSTATETAARRNQIGRTVTVSSVMRLLRCAASIPRSAASLAWRAASLLCRIKRRLNY